MRDPGPFPSRPCRSAGLQRTLRCSLGGQLLFFFVFVFLFLIALFVFLFLWAVGFLLISMLLLSYRLTTASPVPSPLGLAAAHGSQTKECPLLGFGMAINGEHRKFGHWHSKLWLCFVNHFRHFWRLGLRQQIRDCAGLYHVVCFQTPSIGCQLGRLWPGTAWNRWADVPTRGRGGEFVLWPVAMMNGSQTGSLSYLDNF